MRIWKWVGLAGVVGAAAVGIAVGTSAAQRKRREFVDANPDELRVLLHQRFAEAQARDAG
jgi:hypothetical protein